VTYVGEPDQDRPDVEEIIAYLLQLSKQPKRRVVRGVICGQTVWVKRYDRGLPPLGKVIHEAISPFLWPAVLKASPHRNARELAEREARKIAAFRAAGLNVPQVFYRKGSFIVLSHEGVSLESVLSDLRTRDPVAHDRLLAGCVDLLARVHNAGLCHGRPHKRDIVVEGDTWSFVDFEEEPEAVMPLGAAQARDVWLLFLRIAHSALDGDTPRRAFTAYRRSASEAVLEELRTLVRIFRPLLPVLRVILRVRPGGDLDSVRIVTELIDRELDRPLPAITEAVNNDVVPADADPL